jgi:hypothetical protein
MSESRNGAPLPRQDARRLCAVLGAEEREYRRLLRLAWRQAAYLRRGDVDRLEGNAREWQRCLAATRRAREIRETVTAEITTRLGLRRDRQEPQFLLDLADNESRREIRAAVEAVVTKAAELGRQNELNRQLAGFCLDLVSEEAEIFRRAVLEDPAGRYAGDARKAQAGPGGVFIKQA